MIHEADEIVTMAQLHTMVIVQHTDIEDNASLVEEAFRAEFERHYAEGLIADAIPDGMDLVWQWAKGAVSTQAARNQRSIKGRLKRKTMQAFIDLGDDFDSPTLVCGKSALGDGATCGRISTLGLLTDHDFALIASESKSNRRQVDAADDELQESMGLIVPVLRNYRNYRAYRRATDASAA